MNVKIFVYSCLLWKMEKQHSRNLSHFENESPFQKRTTSWKWKLIPTPISKNENISFFETAINKKYKERFKSVCWCQIQLIEKVWMSLKGCQVSCWQWCRLVRTKKYSVTSFYLKCRLKSNYFHSTFWYKYNRVLCWHPLVQY